MKTDEHADHPEGFGAAPQAASTGPVDASSLEANQATTIDGLQIGRRRKELRRR
jgi:hypothetical protein